MMYTFKRLIVIALEKSCSIIDRVCPWYASSCRLAAKSEFLDSKWGTNVWWTELEKLNEKL